MRKSRKAAFGAVGMALALLLSACQLGGDGTTTEGEDKGTIIVGVSASFTENVLVAEMYAQILEANGYTVDRQLELGSREVSQPALEDGQIHVKPEYLATLLTFYDEDAEDLGTPEGVEAQLGPILEENGVTLLAFSNAVDTNALVVTSETATAIGGNQTSDLADDAGDLTLGGPPECPNRPFCIPGFMSVYGIEFGEFKPLDVGGPLTVEALRGGEIDVALLFSTNPQISANGWVVLEDDMNLQAADYIAPVVNSDVLTDEIEQLLNSVSAVLTTDNVTALNAQIDIDGEDEADVAREFLESQDLI